MTLLTVSWKTSETPGASPSLAVTSTLMTPTSPLSGVPVNWPIGAGSDFRGVLAREFPDQAEIVEHPEAPALGRQH